MPIIPFKAKDLGKYPRTYDLIVEKEEGDKAIIAEVLKWMADPVPENAKEPPKAGGSALRELVEGGLAFANADQVAALATVRRGQGFVGPVLDDLEYAARDLWAGKRVKTSLTITAGILIGATAGMVLGTLVFPLIGTAIGGAAGAAIVGGLSMLGGGVGLSIIGAFAGSWFGTRISKKLFKTERRFELSRRITQQIRQNTGVRSEVVQMMNGYLYNREKAIDSPLCKRYYKLLRISAFRNASAVAMEKVARFFCHELSLLSTQIDPQVPDSRLQDELEAVFHILLNLERAEGLSLATREKIAGVIKDFQAKKFIGKDLRQLGSLVQEEREILQQERKLLASVPMTFSAKREPSAIREKVKQGLMFHHEQPISRDNMHAMKERFLKELRSGGFGIKKANAIHVNNFRLDRSSYRYQVILENNTRLPEMVFREKRVDKERSVTEIMIDKADITPSNRILTAQMIIEQAKAYAASTGNNKVTVIAENDDSFAMELLVASYKAGLNPKLSAREYPDHIPEMRARKEKIIKDALNIATSGLSVPTPKGKMKMEPP